MRWVVVVVVLIAGRASAETRCYAGTQSEDGKRENVVLEIELDAAKRELREHIWSETHPNDSVTLHRIAADGKTLTWGNKRFTGTGTLFGKLGTWSGWHREGDAYGALLTTDTKLDDAALTMALRVSRDGKALMAIDIDAKAFDCKDLAVRRGILDGVTADAKHACFEGTQTVEKNTDPVIIEQVSEAKRFVIVAWMRNGRTRDILEIDGAKVAVHDPANTYTAKGTLIGKPGAWTAYSYKLDGMDITVNSTLGGTHLRRVVSGKTPGGDKFEIAADADAFDCSELDKRRAAMK